MRTQLAVITGGPFSGKTTLVEALVARGYDAVPEAGIQVIEELNAELGVEGQRQWRQGHRVAFQERVLRRQIELEEAALRRAPAVLFLDRSRVDGLAYCRHFGVPAPAGLAAAIDAQRYDRVFVLDTLSAAHVRRATGRTSDAATSIALRDCLEAVYRELGYSPVRVPEQAIERRVQLVLDHLSEPS